MKHPTNKWRDSSSYNQDDKVRTPTSYSLNTDSGALVTVHRWIDDPGVWFVTCYTIGINSRQRLKAVKIEKALVEALIVCRSWVQKHATMLERAVLRAKPPRDIFRT